ncbi:MAG TPA: FHA domain-containing protein, partial [Polyangiaceae bacterium]|nr:FHA domain-containing protein [Polyangiaceae bacterium]
MVAQEAHNIEIYRAGRSQPDRTVPLTGTQLIVGRNETAQVFLDHDTVSRPHAQLTCGPFGRWWIHDLGSTNGTYVNGTRVKERMLNPGDEVRIGDYTLRLSLPRQPALSTTPPAQPTPVVSDTYDDMSPVPASSREAPRIDATLLSTAMALGRRLMTIEDPRGRLEELCNFLIGRDFPAVAAIALRMRGRDELKVLHGPVHRNGPAAVGGHYSRRVLQAVWQDRDAVLATNATSLKHVKKITLPGSIRPMAVVACPIWADDERLDVLYVELPATHGTDEWRTLVTLVADAYKQADLMWDMRRHVRSSAF